jgi:hypothetical protein
MYTAMALVALTVGNLTTNPTWLDDYSAAQAKVTVAGKPMAVFVGTGRAGWEAAVRDGLDPSVSKMLAEKFVCLYVDSSTAKGKTLAAAFQVGDRGVVLSDRTGQTQAYSAAGTISRSELNRALLAYADVEVAQKTDTPKVSSGSATTGSVSGGAVITGPPGAMPGGVMTGPGGAMMAPPPGYMGGPMMGGPGYGGGCGQPMGGCGGGGGHGCCLLGGLMGGMGGGCGHSGGCGGGGCGGGMGHGCGGRGGGWGGGGHGCCGLFGGMMGGWGGGCGGGMGHGGGGCH